MAANVAAMATAAAATATVAAAKWSIVDKITAMTENLLSH